MKKLIFVLACILVTSTLSAQIKKGQWLAGGNANWTTTSQSDYSNGNSTVISVNPDVGYFFIDKLAGGIKINYSFINQSGGSAYNSYGFLPFVRYYVLPADKNINVFAEVATGWGNAYQGGYSGNSHVWSISAGPAFFLNKHVALECALNFSNYSGSNYNSGDAQTFGMNIGFQIHLGK